MTRTAFALAALLAPLPAAAEELACRLAPEGGGAEVALSFAIDRRQFAPATSPDDPPRQVRSYVRQDGQQYLAEPFLMEGGIRGFWSEARAGGQTLLLIEKDGSARMTDGPTGASLAGRCEETG